MCLLGKKKIAIYILSVGLVLHLERNNQIIIYTYM